MAKKNVIMQYVVTVFHNRKNVAIAYFKNWIKKSVIDELLAVLKLSNIQFIVRTRKSCKLKYWRGKIENIIYL